MFELRVFGTLQISASDGRNLEVLVRQSKRTALLVHLAVAVPRGLHRRDKLLTLFWPESDDPHARAALNQALYVLRTTLDEHAIVTRGDDDVGLDHDVVWSDVAAFEAALDSQRFAEALALYRGDLLDGFYVTGCSEFEQWLERERRRLRQRAWEGAWGLAEARAAAGDVVEAQRWARWAFDLAPADEAGARRLMTFLDRLGDRAAAIRVYEGFARDLAREYELEPSAETQAQAAAIRQEQQHPAAVRVAKAVRRLPREVLVAASRSRLTRWFAGLAVAAVVALGALGLWVRRLSEDPAVQGGLPRLVVLPFQNLGTAEDEYFADGITDEITSRLAQVSGLLVVSRTSAGMYRDRNKPVWQIGEELGADYVLDGTVRTDRASSGAGEVRVSPQLIRVLDDANLWADRYTATPVPGDIFRVQADIAERVAQALGVTLLEPERRMVVARPTESLQAYDFYLRGNDYFNRSFSESDMRIAAQMYERAVSVDSGFALAYARLAQIHAQLYWFFYDRSASRLADAKAAVQRALDLDANLPEAHIALGYVHYWGELAYDGALAAFRTARQLQPNNTTVLEAMAQIRRRQGAFGDATRDFGSALELDPRSVRIAFQLGQTYALLGDDAQAEHYYDHVISLAPEFNEVYWNKVRLQLRADRNTVRARAVLASPNVSRDDPLIQYHAILIDLFDAAYDAALGRLASTSSDAFESQWQFIPAGSLRAQAYALMNRPAIARTQHDSARIEAERRVRARPEEANFHSALAIAYAGLGRATEAITEARRAVDLLPVTRDAWRGLYRIEDLARVYVMVGDYESALEQLERLISLPGGKSIPFLELDPAWIPLRDHARFRALLSKTED